MHPGVPPVLEWHRQCRWLQQGFVMMSVLHCLQLVLFAKNPGLLLCPFPACWALKRKREGRYCRKDSLRLAPSPLLSVLQQAGLSALHLSLLCKSPGLRDRKVKDQNLPNFNNPSSIVMKTYLHSFKFLVACSKSYCL